MNDRNHLAWMRLAAAARRAPRAAEPEGACDAPVGFAARVVARAELSSSGAGSGFFGRGFDRVASRALGLACACAVAVALWASTPATAEARSGDSVVTDAYLDPVGDYLVVVQS